MQEKQSDFYAIIENGSGAASFFCNSKEISGSKKISFNKARETKWFLRDYWKRKTAISFWKAKRGRRGAAPAKPRVSAELFILFAYFSLILPKYLMEHNSHLRVYCHIYPIISPKFHKATLTKTALCIIIKLSGLWTQGLCPPEFDFP